MVEQPYQNRITIAEYIGDYAATSREIVDGTKLSRKQVADALQIMSRRDKLIHKLPVTFGHGRALGQVKLFGRRLGKYIWYINRKGLIRYLADNMKPLGASVAYNVLHAKGLTYDEVQQVLELWRQT